jgi:L-threonylcarbamoyladenylate synthase
MSISAVQADAATVIMPSDPADYARELYATLRRLDSLGFDQIFVEAPPLAEPWLAVNDRLSRAAVKQA